MIKTIDIKKEILLRLIRIMRNEPRLDGLFIIPEGLFINEEKICELAEKYRESRVVRMSNNPKEQLMQARNELLRLGSRELYYLIGNHRCSTGYVADFGIDSFTKLGLSNREGKLISCKDNLIPQDPLFKEHSTIRLFPKRGCIARFRVDEFDYYIQDHVFERFEKRVRENIGSLEKRLHSRIDSKRELLVSMYEHFSSSVPVLRKNAVAQFFRHKQEGAEYRASGGWIYVITGENTVRTVYFKGKEVGELYKKEKVSLY